MTTTRFLLTITGSIAVAFSFFPLGGCGGAHDNQTTLELTGSSTLAPLMVEIAKRYEEVNRSVNVVVQAGGSDRGISDAAEGLADLGMSSRVLKNFEKNGNITHIIAEDGIGMLVNTLNPVTELTDEQIVGIYTGKIRNWKEVGGNDAPINCINRSEGRSELELFQEFFDLRSEDLLGELISGDNEHGIQTVAEDENAITYLSVGAAEFQVANGAPVRLLPFHGVEASSRTIRTGEYPLSRPLILISKPKPSEATSKFLEYALSSDVHDLVTRLSFVPAKGR